MSYEKPEPSVRLVVGGLSAVAAGLIIRLYSTPDPRSAMTVISWVLLAGGACLTLVGLSRALAAFDRAVLHRWQSVTAAKQEELRLKDGQPHPGPGPAGV